LEFQKRAGCERRGGRKKGDAGNREKKGLYLGGAEAWSAVKMKISSAFFGVKRCGDRPSESGVQRSRDQQPNHTE